MLMGHIALDERQFIQRPSLEARLVVDLETNGFPVLTLNVVVTAARRTLDATRVAD
jgi:hypothetical protein